MLKNVTLSADEALVHKAREKAVLERTTLNASFREWLASYVWGEHRGEGYRQLMKRLSHVRAGRAFSRDELNAR